MKRRQMPTENPKEPKRQQPDRIEDHPAPQANQEQPASRQPDPTRYGDWEKNGRCIDF